MKASIMRGLARSRHCLLALPRREVEGMRRVPNPPTDHEGILVGVILESHVAQKRVCCYIISRSSPQSIESSLQLEATGLPGRGIMPFNVAWLLSESLIVNISGKPKG